MTDGTSGNNEPTKEPEDLLTIVERMRSLPRIKPTRMFRARMLFFSLFPALGVYFANKHEASIIERSILGTDVRKPRGWVVSAGRIAVGVALVLILAFGAFGTLVFAARNSKPGDALYSVKRFGEGLELAFTWNDTQKAEKSLSLAQARLSELDYLISKKKLDAGEVRSVVNDYSDKTKAVEDLLSQGGAGSDSQELASQLKVIKTNEKNIEKRLAAAGPQATLAAATGAQVTVKDSSGSPTISGRSELKTRAGNNGQVSFIADLSDTRTTGNLEVLVEQDGRSEILPLYPAEARPNTGPITARVTPAAAALAVGQPQLFTLTLFASDGSRTAGRQLRLIDNTGTSSINGAPGEVSLVTDSTGTCTFTLNKESLDHVSRITARLSDSTFEDLGEVLTVGGLLTQGAGRDTTAVRATSIGAASGSQNIELDNGIIKITANGNTTGEVIEGMTGVALAGSTGPVYDPVVSTVQQSLVLSSGPRLTFASPDAAGYEVSFEFPVGNATVRKTYVVALARGNRYATVRCTVEVGGSSGNADTSSILGVFNLQAPAGAGVEVSGKKVSLPGSDNPALLDFQAGAPSAVLSSSGFKVVLACPIDAETYPQSWVLGNGYVGLRLPASAGQAGAETSVTALVGISDQQGLAELEAQALRGVGEVTPAQTTALPSNGFLVTTNPPVDKLTSGTQRVKLGIFKQYERVFGR